MTTETASIIYDDIPSSTAQAVKGIVARNHMIGLVVTPSKYNVYRQDLPEHYSLALTAADAKRLTNPQLNHLMVYIRGIMDAIAFTAPAHLS